MKRKLLSISVTCGAVICIPIMAAAGELTVSGSVRVGPYITHSTAAATGDPEPRNEITDINNQNPDRYRQGFWREGVSTSDSAINVNASQEIGWGTAVLFQYQFDISELGASLAHTGHRLGTQYLLRTGISYLGLGGPWGALKMGTAENVYLLYLCDTDPLDNAAGIGASLQMFGSPGYGVVFDVGQMEVSRETGQAGFSRRTDQNIWYESPDIEGVSFGASLSLNAYQEEADTDQDILGSTSPRVISVGAQYKPSYLPFYVNAAYEYHIDLFGINAIMGVTNNGVSSRDTGLKAQAGLVLPLATIGFIVEHLKYTIEEASYVREYQRMAYGVHGKLNLPFGYVGLNAGFAQNGRYRLINAQPPAGEPDLVDESAELYEALDSMALFWGLGYFHHITEEVQAQVMASQIDNGVNASYALAANATANHRIAGADHTAVYAGIKYTF
jgi:predicted porin